MNENEKKASRARTIINFDLGTFEGFNFRDQCGVWGNRSASEVIDWNDARQGEAEFWPSGDNDGVSLIFSIHSSVAASELLALNRLLVEYGEATDEVYLKIHWAVNECGHELEDLIRDTVEGEAPMIFFAETFSEARTDAAFELFETFYPELFRLFVNSACKGLSFNPEKFLDSPAFSVSEVMINRKSVLLVSPG